MTIVKLHANRYSHAMYGRGINGKYYKVRMRHGYGIMDSIGKDASKYILGGVGKSTGSYYGKQLGKLIGDKTGSKLVGTIAKSALGSLGGLAGDKLGKFAGHHLGNTVFGNDEKKKKEKDKEKKQESEKVSLSQLLDNARKALHGQIMGAKGINIPGAGMQGSGIMLSY